MKTRDDFKRAIGPADDRFVLSIHQTLAQLNKEEQPVKKISTGLIVAVAILLIAAVAIAATAQWGILDFFNLRGDGASVSPEANQIIQKQIAQEGGETEYASFSLREGVFDGHDTYLVVAVKPASDKILLMGPDLLPEDPMENLGPLFDGSSLTVADWAAQNGKEQLVQISILDQATRLGLEGVVSSLDYIMEEDGTLVFMAHGSHSYAEQLPIELVCHAKLLGDLSEADGSESSVSSLSFTLYTVTDRDKSVTSTQGALFADCGVEVTSVTLTATPLATYTRIEFTVVDEDAYANTDDGLWFEFLDENGERLPDSVSGGGSSGPAEEGDSTHYVQLSSIAATEELPKTITLRGFNCWEKNRYETHSFEME